MRQLFMFCLLCLAATPTVAAPLDISEKTFGCIRDLTPVRGFFVDNLKGPEALEETLAVAHNTDGGVYPEGSVVQLVPTEVMIKRERGYNAATRDWEFFELEVSAEGSAIRTRGAGEVFNRFGGNCLGCHIKAKPQFDLVCEKDHGCDPIPLTTTMISAIQKTDPRCTPTPLSEDEMAALKALMAASPAGDAPSDSD